MSTNRFLGMTQEQQLEFEQATGVKTEAAQVIIDHSVAATQEIFDRALKEIQSVVGPHGALSRIQAGGMKISPGFGMSVFADGVLKTTIDPAGNLFVGSDIANPAYTTFSAFVNDQVYNNEDMGAGDLLIGDNTAGASNVKYDASEGQLQFRAGTTIQVFIDTDGSLNAGAGSVILNQDGIDIPDAGDAIVFSSQALYYGFLSLLTTGNLYGTPSLRLLDYELAASTNQITNGDFETGSLSSWTETDPDSAISISSVGQGYGGGYAVHFVNSTSSDKIAQNTAVTCTYGIIVKLRVKTSKAVQIIFNNSSGQYMVQAPIVDDWRTFYVGIAGSVTTFTLQVIEASAGAGVDTYIDDIEVLKIGGIVGTTGYFNALEMGRDRIRLTSDYLAMRQFGQTTTDDISITTLVGGVTFFNGNQKNLDFEVCGTTDLDLIRADASTNRVGIGTATPASKLDVVGDVNISGAYRIGGVALTSTNAIAETNTNDIYLVSSPGGVSAFVGTINGTPSGANVTYNVTSGQEGAMVPAATTQLAKMRLYNTTRGNSALISNCNTTTNVVTLTANAPANWANGDTITIASQTVSGGGFSWVDLEITSGPTGKSYMFVKTQITSATVGDSLRIHPFSASFSSSKLDNVIAQVANNPMPGFGLIVITSNVFSIAWTGTPTSCVIREAGYLS